MLKTIRIWWLKRRAAHHMRKIETIRWQYLCGSPIPEWWVTKRIRNNKAKLSRILDKLRDAGMEIP